MALTALNVVSDPYYADANAVAASMQPEEAVFCFSAERLRERLALFTRGFPGTVSFVTSIAPICIALGIPVEPLALLIAVETLPDIFRTTGNVQMDVALATAIEAPEKENVHAIS